jgi:hypothetical protein
MRRLQFGEVCALTGLDFFVIGKSPCIQKGNFDGAEIIRFSRLARSLYT